MCRFSEYIAYFCSVKSLALGHWRTNVPIVHKITMEIIKKVTNTDKILLRSEIKKRFSLHDADYFVRHSEQIFCAVEHLPQFISACRVGLYVSLGDEPRTEEFIARWAGHKKLFFPSTEGCEMFFREFTGQWHKGRFCREATGEVYSQLDMIIVPAVAFDARGYRLGRGGGFYDRYMAANPTFSVGVCYPYALLSEVPTEEHDCKVDTIITL